MTNIYSCECGQKYTETQYQNLVNPVRGSSIVYWTMGNPITIYNEPVHSNRSCGCSRSVQNFVKEDIPEPVQPRNIATSRKGLKK